MNIDAILAGDCSCLLKNLSVEDMNALLLAFVRPRGRLEISSPRLLMLFRAIRGGARGFVSMGAVQKAAVMGELGTKVVKRLLRLENIVHHYSFFHNPS